MSILDDVAAAVDARLEAHGARVAGVNSTAYPYVTTYVSAPVSEPLSDLCDSRSTVVFTISTVVVGESEEQCRALLGRVSEAFRRWRPAVGARAWLLVHTAAMSVAPDDDLPDRRVWTARDMWSLTVALAPAIPEPEESS